MDYVMADEALKSTVLLIRHAKSTPKEEIPEADWPLSQLGHEQAVGLADQLCGYGITAVVSSPCRRAIDTVSPLAERLGFSVRLVDDLRERKLREGIRDDWEALTARSWADFSFALPNCESAFDAQKRMQNALDHLTREYPGQTIAACSHGNAISLFLNTIDPGFGHAQWQAMKNPDIFRVTWDGRLWRESGLN
jgi:2,3-bisphosphoglycerate-dependent phosphoglycerate mutase